MASVVDWYNACMVGEVVLGSRWIMDKVGWCLVIKNY